MMRTRSALVLAASALTVLCAWVYFALQDGDPARGGEVASTALDGSGIGRAPRAAVVDSSAPYAPDVEAPRALDAGLARPERRPGYLVADPDSLVAVKGLVIDAITKEPLRGMRLRFLSRRPRTSTVVSDAEGRFQTAAELAPGVISVVHMPDGDVPRFSVGWEMDPGEFLVSDPALDPTLRDLVLTARSPERVLEVDIHAPDGTPAAAASVTLTYGRRDSAGEFVSEGRDYEVSDAKGRVRFAQFGPDSFDRSFRIEAEQRGVLTSDVITLDPPIGSRPLVLDLHPGAVLRVHAKNDEGRPIANLSLWVSENDSGRFATGHNGDTDAHGECMFSPLRPGCYTVNAVNPLTGETLQRELDLARGAQASVDLRLTLANLRLGLSGVVIDETGSPISGIRVRIQPAGEAPVELVTSDNGRFEFWGEPSSGLSFSIGTGFMDDEYDPGVLNVPFGTSGLTVRRVRRLATYSLPFAVVDRETGAPARRASIVLYHGDPARTLQSEQRFSAQAGVAQVSFKLRGDTGFAVDAPGYVRAQGSLRSLFEAQAHAASLRVELVPGFERRIQVRDRISKHALAGAHLFEDRRMVGTTDAQGVIEVSAPEWPTSYRVECSGYQPTAWDPLAAGFPGDVIWLDPQRVGR